MTGVWSPLDGAVTDAATLAAAVDDAGIPGFVRFFGENDQILATIEVAFPAFVLAAGVYSLASTPWQVEASVKGRIQKLQLLRGDGDPMAEGPADTTGAGGAVIETDRARVEPGDFLTVRSLSFEDSEGSIVGDGVASLFTAGDRNINLTLAHSWASGACCFARAAGTRLAVACSRSGRVLIVDALEPRNLSVVGQSAVLSPPPVMVASDDTHIYAYCYSPEAKGRALVVLSNSSAPEQIQRVDIDEFGDDTGAWVSVQAEAGVIAYPVDKATVAIRDTDTLEEIDRAHCGVFRSSSAVWKTFALANRPLVGTTENLRYYLYVKGAGADLGVLELNRLFDSGVLLQQSWRTVAKLRLPASNGADRLTEGAEYLLSSGAVNGRGPVTPIFEGVRLVSDGSYVAVWGYRNDSGVAVYQPRATSGLTRNRLVGLPAGDQDVLPEVLLPGRVRRAVVLISDGTDTAWELQTQSGGGYSELDFTMEASAEEIDRQPLYASRAEAYRSVEYALTGPTTIDVEYEVTEVDPSAKGLTAISLSFSGNRVLRHTTEPNEDLPGVSHWYPRAWAVRVEGGWVSAHGLTAHLTRYAPEALAKEGARGALFSLPEGTIAEFDPVYQDPSVAQAGEQMGWEIGHSGDGTILALSAENYTEGGFVKVGRVHLFLGRSDGSAVPRGVVTAADAGFIPSSNLQFSRFTEVNFTGDRLFVGGKNSPGIAVFALTPSGEATLFNTLTWPEYSGLPSFERAHEARVSKDGKILLLSTGDAFGGATTAPGKVHVLYSEDNWSTFEVRQVFSRSDEDGAPDGFTTLDCDEECSVLGIGAWRRGLVYAYRTTDRWLSFTEYPLTPPAEIAGDPADLGITMAVSSDGFRIAAGAPGADWDQGFGARVNNGLVAVYTWEESTGDYSTPTVLAPADELAADSTFGNAVRFNAPGNRLSVVASGIPRQYLFGIGASGFEEIARVDDAFVGGSADTRWLYTKDTLLVANKTEDNGAVVDVGAFRLLSFPEEP